MNGIEFYEFLRRNYTLNGQALYGNFTFCEWLFKRRTNSFSFRFNIPKHPPKSIPKSVIIASWEANIHIDDNWLEDNFDLGFYDDCRLHVLNFLLTQHQTLR